MTLREAFAAAVLVMVGIPVLAWCIVALILGG